MSSADTSPHDNVAIVDGLEECGTVTTPTATPTKRGAAEQSDANTTPLKVLRQRRLSWANVQPANQKDGRPKVQSGSPKFDADSPKFDADTLAELSELQDVGLAAHEVSQVGVWRDCDAGEVRLRTFDLDPAFGPCSGLTRKERWQQADALHLQPPSALLALFPNHDQRSLVDRRVL